MVAHFDMPDDEFVAQIRAMDDETLLRTYREYHAKFDALEKERMRCWNRMMEVRTKQDKMSEKLGALNAAVHYGRKLKVK